MEGYKSWRVGSPQPSLTLFVSIRFSYLLISCFWGDFIFLLFLLIFIFFIFVKISFQALFLLALPTKQGKDIVLRFII
jgi:hypothetical protein